MLVPQAIAFPQLHALLPDGSAATFPPRPDSAGASSSASSSSSSGGGGGGGAAELPSARAALACVAFRAGAQPMLDAWGEHFAAHFAGRAGAGLYELALVEGVVRGGGDEGRGRGAGVRGGEGGERARLLQPLPPHPTPPRSWGSGHSSRCCCGGRRRPGTSTPCPCATCSTLATQARVIRVIVGMWGGGGRAGQPRPAAPRTSPTAAAHAHLPHRCRPPPAPLLHADGLRQALGMTNRLTGCAAAAACPWRLFAPPARAPRQRAHAAPRHPPPLHARTQVRVLVGRPGPRALAQQRPPAAPGAAVPRAVRRGAAARVGLPASQPPVAPGGGGLRARSTTLPAFPALCDLPRTPHCAAC